MGHFWRTVIEWFHPAGHLLIAATAVTVIAATAVLVVGPHLVTPGGVPGAVAQSAPPGEGLVTPGGVPSATAQSDSSGESMQPCIDGGYINTFRSAGGNFSLWFPTSVEDPAPIADRLEQSLTSAKALGLDLRSHPLPICVLIQPFPAGSDRWGEFAEDSGGWLHINADGLANPADLPEVLRTAAHEFFHLVQSGYDPSYALTRKFNEAWLWMDDASATWFEGYSGGTLGSPASTTVRNAAFLFKHGLRFDSTYVPGVYNVRSDAQDHGYGAAMFLSYLTAKGYGDKLVGYLYQRKLTFPQPIDALADALGGTAVLSSQWQAFADAYGAGTVYPGSSPGSFPTRDQFTLGLQPGDDVAYPNADAARAGSHWGWQAPDLSARAFRILRKPDPAWDLPADAPAVITVSGPPETHTTIYSFTGTSAMQVLGTVDGNGPFTVEGAGALLNGKQGLYVMVTNARAVPPYDGESPTALTVTVGKPPHIDAVVPDHGPAGTMIKLSGTDFGTGPSASARVLAPGGVSLPTTSWTDTQIRLQIPTDAAPGATSLQVAIGWNVSNKVAFTVDSPIAPPFPAGKYYVVVGNGGVQACGQTVPIDSFYADIDASGGVSLSLYVAHPGGTNKLSGRGTVRPNPDYTTMGTQPKYLWDVAFDDTNQSSVGQFAPIVTSHFVGTWDGDKVNGTVTESSDAGGTCSAQFSEYATNHGQVP